MYTEEEFIEQADRVSNWSEYYENIKDFSQEFFDSFVFDLDGEIMLTWACVHGYGKTADKLIKSGVKPDKAFDKRGYKQTALMDACYHGHTEIAKILIKHGANINNVDEDLDTPLTHAIRGLNFVLVSFLIRSGADVHKKNKDGRTALMYAVQNNLEVVVDLLLEKGADPLETDVLQDCALTIAHRLKHMEIYQKFLTHIKNKKY